MSSIAGIDQALWDIKGKYYGAPIYELLGGRARDRIRAYQWIGGDTPEEIAAAAAAAVDDGYRTLKMPAVSQLRRIDSPQTVQLARERLEAVRETVGTDVDIGVDFRGRVTKGMAKWLASELDPYDPMFYEEPVLPEHFDVLPQLEVHTKTPIASGERLYSRWEFKLALDESYVDIIQPDPSHAGGITEVQKIANAAEANDISVAPHCPLGPIAFAACVQLDIAVPNVLVQGQNLDIHTPRNNDLMAYLADPTVFDFDDGYLYPPDAPGLGLEFDTEHIREQATAQIDWQNPLWYHEDGSVAEW